MPRRHHRRTRSASSSSSSGASDAASSSSASSSGSSDSDSRRRLRDNKHQKRRHKHGGNVSGSSSSGSSSSSDDDYGHHKLSKKDKKERQHLFYAAAGVFVLCLAVALWYALSNKSSTAAAPASSGVAAGGAGTTSAAGTSKATGGGGTTKASSHAASTTAKTSAISSKATATATASAADASNTGPYKLTVAHEGDSFFDGWTFFTDAGQVTYVSQDDAKSAGLISTSATSAIMRVDNTTTLASGANRNSVRITSTDAVKIGSMVIADIVRMPWGCATWPAWWMVGTNWPDNGEIDIIEGVNNDDTNQLTLHTKDSDCKQSSDVKVTGTVVAANTDCNANNNGNTGCSYAETAANSYGENFNKAGGGVIVTQFTADAISIWFWPRADIPANIISGSPDSATWGDPSASWPKSSCDIASYFGDQNLVFDTTLCGDWAGSSGVWSADSTCAAAASSCSDYVADPSHFDEAWWEVGYVRVYSVG
ncbi:hypothetical protein JCM8097_000627 [Rhodosporidiobolus ruineniae]